MLKAAVVFSLALFFTAPVFAHDLMIEDAVVRTTPSTTAAGYVTIMNHGKKDDTLLGASATWAKRVELHEMTTDDKGVMTMAKQAAMPVPADDTLTLEPNGKHLMIFEVSHKVTPGEIVPITLSFQNAGDVTVDFTAKAVTDTIKASAHQHHH